ncbi:hypothetical protein HaLaN_25700 [Haematococcus lacustris]|uniref:Uncharacterized protein n=1 Tax=Haematococcus lacustris TaxID=44745 RepID=A0A699ZWS9_HAELA|nr:hypothetical protein HaLaN_25700 [Haematococcus lacustris]
MAVPSWFNLWLQFESQELSSSVVAPWQSNLARYSRSNALHADGLGHRGEGDEGRAGVDSAVQGVVRMASALSNQAAEVAAEVARTASAVAALRLMDASSVSCTLSLLAPLAERESKACALMRRLPPGCQLSSLRIVQKEQLAPCGRAARQGSEG